ncbi:flavodoxin [Gordonia sp. X0973]|uniref:flavodoxin family protein n=1 Tax=Gordonia sp. X0973 TaxID=2742602 RepID=UPI000F53E4ED|nr:flavodoxin family protein [Gordonia sp. X0973]QKT08501.1 flavodoxin [Gordonia sp. X0973]
MSTNALLICVSVSHGNTRRVADAMAGILDARIVEPEEVTVADLADYDLVGFGSGIFYQRFHERLRGFVEDLPPLGLSGRAFVFGTSGFPPLTTKPLQKRLEAAGLTVAGEFLCRGYDTSPPFGWFGGAKKDHPLDADLDRAESFAAALK